MAVGDALKGDFQVCERIDAVDLGRFDQGCDAAPGLVGRALRSVQGEIALEPAGFSRTQPK